MSSLSYLLLTKTGWNGCACVVTHIRRHTENQFVRELMNLYECCSRRGCQTRRSFACTANVPCTARCGAGCRHGSSHGCCSCPHFTAADSTACLDEPALALCSNGHMRIAFLRASDFVLSSSISTVYHVSQILLRSQGTTALVPSCIHMFFSSAHFKSVPAVLQTLGLVDDANLGFRFFPVQVSDHDGRLCNRGRH